MEGGKKERRMAMGSAPGQKARASTVGPGFMALSCRVSTRGPVETPTKAPGLRARDMAWELRIKAAGCTKVNGHTALRDAMVYGRAQGQVESMRGHGTMDFKMDMEQKHTLMEVGVGRSWVFGAECENVRPCEHV